MNKNFTVSVSMDGLGILLVLLGIALVEYVDPYYIGLGVLAASFLRIKVAKQAIEE